MAESHGFVKLPPDGTGKRIPHTVMFEVSYNTGVTPFIVGAVVTFSTSGFSGTVVEVEGNTISGNLHVRLDEPVPLTPSVSIGESIMVSGAEAAKVSTVGYAFYFQQSVISGGNDPTNTMSIDDKGAASVRFPEGSPQFDAFGKMQVSQHTTLSEYVATYDLDPERLGVYTSGSGTITHLPTQSGTLLSVGTGATDAAERISHMYHHYQPGTSQLIEITCAYGDTGKANNTRIIGYGDDDDGLYFILQGTDFGVLKRSSVSGTVVPSFVPKAEWNVDRLDGSGGEFNQSGFTLDITKDNIYWIDFQWLGAGRVRYGVIIGGHRITCHQMDHANTQPNPYMRTGSLPIYAENMNTGVTGASSELRVWCMVVKSEGHFDPEHRSFCLEVPSKTFTSSTFTPFVSFRSKQQFNGLNNHVSAYGSLASMLSTGAPVIVAFFKNAALTGATFALSPDPLSSVEGDTAATAMTGGRIVCSRVVNTNDQQVFDLEKIFNHRGEAMRRHAHIAGYDSYTVGVRLLSGTTTDLYSTVGWRES